MHTYQSPPAGNEISCIFHGISPEIINNNALIRETLLAAIEVESFHVLGIVDHHFEPQGYSAVILFSESHATIHTYPEYGSFVFHIYGCRSEQDGVKTLAYLKKHFGATRCDELSRRIIVDRLK